MPAGFLQQFPDTTTIVRQQDVLKVDVDGLLGGLAALQSSDADSPLAVVVTAMHDLAGRIDIDMSGLSTQLPATIEVIESALPPSAIEYVTAIEAAYTSLQDSLSNNPLLRTIGHGQTLQDTALAVIGGALTQFEAHVADLAAHLIDPETLAEVRLALVDIEQFGTNFADRQTEFLPFLARNLVGVAPDLLAVPLGRLDAALALVGPLDAETLNTRLGQVRQSLADAVGGLASAIDTFDPVQTSDYARVAALLDQIDAASAALLTALVAVYQGARTVVDSAGWETVFMTYRDALQTIDVNAVVTLGDVVDRITGVIDEIVAQVVDVLDADDLSGRTQLLTQSISDTVATSGLAAAREALGEAIADIARAIESVPTQEVQAAVQDMLGQVKYELDALDIGQIGATIEGAFKAIDAFVAGVFTADLTSKVKTTLEGVLGSIDTHALDDLVGSVRGAVEQVDKLIGEIDTALQSQFEQVKEFMAQLDELSFKPVSALVIQQIDEIKSRLKAINPSSLSDVERLAIAAALAVLQAIDLEGTLVVELKAGFASAREGVDSLLAELATILARVKDHVQAFDPRALLGPVDDLLRQGTALVDQLNAKTLLQPVYDLLEQLTNGLAQLEPRRLLHDLQQPYTTIMELVGRLDPDAWVAPLRTVYAEIDRLIGLVDVTPLFDELDHRRRQLLAQMRAALLGALDQLHLPQPIQSVLDQLRPVLEGITDVLFGEPDAALSEMSAGLTDHIDLRTPLLALDEPFNALVQSLAAVPADALTEAANSLRTGIGYALERLDPHAIVQDFRAAQSRLTELNPGVLFGRPLTFPALRLTFDARVQAAPPERAGDVASVRAHFEASYTAIDLERAANQTAQLAVAHAGLVAALEQRLASLDLSAVEEVYADLRQQLERIVPDFLRGAQPLAHADIIAGLEVLRPSNEAARLDDALQRFLTRVEPLRETMAGSIASFFRCLSDIVQLIDPLSLKDTVASVYDELRQKLHILDPDALAQAIRDDVLTPLTEPLRAIDPSRIADKLQQTYAAAVAAVNTGVKGILDQIRHVIDDKLSAIRSQMKALVKLVGDAIHSIAAKLTATLDNVEQLVLVDTVVHLRRLVANLGTSFDAELDRVRTAFDAMLAAIPLEGGSTHASAAIRG